VPVRAWELTGRTWNYLIFYLVDITSKIGIKIEEFLSLGLEFRCRVMSLQIIIKRKINL